MLIAKLKLAVGVVLVMALGTTGLIYQASGQPAPAPKRPLSELERLRHENELLQLNLEVVLEKVRAQEAELQTLKNADARAERKAALEKAIEISQSDLAMWEERAAWSERMSQPGRQYVTTAQAEADQARLLSARIHAAESALKTMREADDPQSRKRAADELDKILRKLRDQLSKKIGEG